MEPTTSQPTKHRPLKIIGAILLSLVAIGAVGNLFTEESDPRTEFCQKAIAERPYEDHSMCLNYLESR